MQDNIHASIGQKCPQRQRKDSRTITVEKLNFKYTTSLVTVSTHLHIYVVECLHRQGRPVCPLCVLLREECLKHSAYLTHVTSHLNFENQSNNSVKLIISSLKVHFNNLKVSLPVLPNFKQNLMHMCCFLRVSFFEGQEIAQVIAYTSQA